MIPAMQIHLADCKSTNSLVSGLAKNKLSLCILVLSNMRATYWSANVMHQVFQRAQRLLSNGAGMAQKQTRASCATEVPSTFPPKESCSVDAAQSQILQQTVQNDSQLPSTSTPQMLLDDQPDQSWINFSPQFSDVNQLLSPGFSLNEFDFMNPFSNYPAMAVYDQQMPLLTSISDPVPLNDGNLDGNFSA